jgi:acyl-CoA reductase-like NAD-dependent aldehyde dehydrogenase
MKPFQLIINGRQVPGALTMDVINPATGEVLTTCPRADSEQVDLAVQSAKAAFPAWAKLGMAARRAKIMSIADGIEARKDELARLLTAEQGKPLREAFAEIGNAAAILRVLSAFDLPIKVLKENANEKVIEHRTPLGVVAAITPWNVPITILIIKIGPALLAGNTVVAKPAATTPLSSLRVAEICNEHLPPGVFNMVTDNNDLGGQLTQHPDIAKISFTGSTATGKKVMASAAGSLKRITLELGGNDAAILLDDIDPKSISPRIFAGAMINSGQVCLAIKRIFVHESQYDSVCEELAKLADAAIVGDGMKDDTQYGPLQNKMQFDRVRSLMEQTRRDGRFIAGGEVSDGKGYFIRPSIVRDISDDARLVREEQFGPVVPVLRYVDIDDAVRRANDTSYGLGGTVWSADPERGFAVAMKIDSGVTWVNQHINVHLDIPIGGSKESGFGMELGLEGLAEFTQNHIVYIGK